MDSFVVLSLAKYKTQPVLKVLKLSKLIRSFVIAKLHKNICETNFSLKTYNFSFESYIFGLKMYVLASILTFLALKCMFLCSFVLQNLTKLSKHGQF